MRRELYFTLAASLLLHTVYAQTDTIRQIDIDEVVVSAQRAGAQTPMAYSNVYKQEIKSKTIMGDVPTLIEMLPSVTLSTESGTGTGNTAFRIRGADPSRINVTLDGVPMNDAESQAVFWVNTPELLSSVGSVQVQRGVGTSTNGSATFGGSVNMQTLRPASQPYGNMEVAVGSFNTYRLSMGGGSGITTTGLSVDARYARVLSDGYVQRTASNNQSFFGTLGWYGAHNSLKYTLFYGEQTTGLNGGVPRDSVLAGNRTYNTAGLYTNADGYPQYHADENDNYKQYHNILTYSQQWGAQWRMALTAHYTLGQGFYEQYKASASLSKYGLPKQDVGGALQKKSDLIRQKWLDNAFYGLMATAIYQSGASALTLGAGASRYQGDHFGKVKWAQYNDGSIPANYPYYDNTGGKTEANTFAKYTYTLANKWNLFADLQYRYVYFEMQGKDDNYYEMTTPTLLDTTYTWHFVNPKFGVFYTINTSQSVYISTAVANREPNRSDLKDAAKYEHVYSPTAERLYDTELGYKYNTLQAQFEANVFYMRYHNQIVHSGRLNDSYRPVMENVPDSYRAGLELSGTVRLWQRLQMGANLTYSQNKIKDFTSKTSIDWGAEYAYQHFHSTDIAFSPEWIGAGMVRYEPFKRVGLTFMGKYTGQQYIDNTASADRSLDAFFVAYLKADYVQPLSRGANITLQLLVNNLFNAQYSASGFINDHTILSDGGQALEVYLYPQAGTNVMGKISINF